MVIFCAQHVKYHINKHFASYHAQALHFMLKEVEKHAFSLKKDLTTCYL